MTRPWRFQRWKSPWDRVLSEAAFSKTALFPFNSVDIYPVCLRETTT